MLNDAFTWKEESREKHRLGRALSDILCLTFGNICDYQGNRAAPVIPTSAVFSEDLDLLVYLHPEQSATIRKAVELYARQHDLSSFGGARPADRICKELETVKAQENANRIQAFLEASGIESNARHGKHPRIASMHVIVDYRQKGFMASLQRMLESVAEKAVERTSRLPDDLEESAQARIPMRVDRQNLPLSKEQAAALLADWIRRLTMLAHEMGVEKHLQEQLSRTGRAAQPRERQAA